MERVILVSCAVFLLSHFCVDVILASQKFDETSESKGRDEDDSDEENFFSHLLGRHMRSFSLETDKPRELRWPAKLLEKCLEKCYADSPSTKGKIKCRINGSDCTKIDRYQFIPRTGRNIDEDILENEKWLQDSDNSAEYVIQRSPPFAPRLGKRMPYLYASPRLGTDS